MLISAFFIRLFLTGDGLLRGLCFMKSVEPLRSDAHPVTLQASKSSLFHFERPDPLWSLTFSRFAVGNPLGDKSEKRRFVIQLDCSLQKALKMLAFERQPYARSRKPRTFSLSEVLHLRPKRFF